MEEKIKQSLKEEIKVLKELLNLLDDQHEFISFKKTFELDKIAIDIEEKCKELAQKEMDRRNLIGDTSMKEFIANAKDEELKSVYKEATNLLEEIKLQKDSNDMLIKQVISLTTNMLSILNPDRTPKTYGPYGRR
ncbi:flagellar protein FlgN [Clostridium sporogenes]|jgi:flagellar biosynthesis/type III secretory pathway chaperone|uniref:flagellar protein FlgN n=1 Tax=Clostridium sporogenes TaxID=1509 RepID=UPI000179429E|nr:flagellar protein FlgN [Clostridium sporogenes]MBE6077777.1 flagellar protein FlgN [Clostridium lundense]EDU36112.1 FlgN protein [Clostridium sporogenes ATCC 15579]MCW6094112.1 flagellar protein FlgN [Clostridium sporogenes]NFE66131.1 flagellar protein FlgN [Clostridium sporogenes]NFL77835.1 flagellar protein FlgN [Clostridium sporogenes]